MKKFYFKINDAEPVEFATDPNGTEILSIQITEGDILFTDKDGNTCKLYSETE
jgi:hypothetical protein